ncbi:MAG: hypothetical protein U0X76_12505 [Bacteroidia bacterium]
MKSTQLTREKSRNEKLSSMIQTLISILLLAFSAFLMVKGMM